MRFVNENHMPENKRIKNSTRIKSTLLLKLMPVFSPNNRKEQDEVVKLVREEIFEILNNYQGDAENLDKRN